MIKTEKYTKVVTIREDTEMIYCDVCRARKPVKEAIKCASYNEDRDETNHDNHEWEIMRFDVFGTEYKYPCGSYEWHLCPRCRLEKGFKAKLNYIIKNFDSVLKTLRQHSDILDWTK